MNKILTAIAALTFALAPAARAEGKSYKAKPFSSIEVGGAMQVVYRSAPETTVRVVSGNGDYSDSRIANRGDTLVVSRESLRAKRSWMSWGGRSVSISDDGKVVKVNGKQMPAYTVYVTGPDLGGVTAAQSSRFEARSLQTDTFRAAASSSSVITLAGSAADARLSASSSGEVKAAELAAVKLDVSASSSGEADVFSNGTGDVTINASSSGEVALTSSSAANFGVDVSSGASVRMSGVCGGLTVSASSGAGVESEGLRCERATVNVSSGADVNAYTTVSATGNASSGGSVSFAGKPAEQNRTESSGGSVRFGG